MRSFHFSKLVKTLIERPVMYEQSSYHTPEEKAFLDAVVRGDEGLVYDMCTTGRVDLVRFDGKRESDPSCGMLLFFNPPLVHALEKKNWSMADLLLKLGACPCHAMMCTSHLRDWDVFRFLDERTREANLEPLQPFYSKLFVQYCGDGALEFAEEMMKRGADIHARDCQGHTAMQRAKVNSEHRMCEWLGEKGCC